MIQYQQEQKGLFTFYREQAKLEDQLKKAKTNKHTKNTKSEQQSQTVKNISKKRPQLNLPIPPDYRLRSYLQNRRDFDEVLDYPTAPLKLYEFDQYKKQQSPKGHSVVVLQRKKARQELAYRGSIQRRRSLINRSINAQKQLQNEGVFLKNKQFPFQNEERIESIKYSSVDAKSKQFCKEPTNGAFSDLSQTKFQRKKSYFKNVSKLLKVNIPIPHRYQKSEEKQKDEQKIGTILKNSYSFDLLVDKNSTIKLPEIHNKKDSRYIVPKKYKSKKIELALKSGDSQIIKKIRESLKEEMGKSTEKQDISYVDIGVNNYQKNQTSIDKRLVMEKNAKLLDILRKLKRGY